MIIVFHVVVIVSKEGCNNKKLSTKRGLKNANSVCVQSACCQYYFKKSKKKNSNNKMVDERKSVNFTMKSLKGDLFNCKVS